MIVQDKKLIVQKNRPRSILLNAAKARLWRFNQSWCAAILGGLGTGKSWSAISIADYIMDGKFDSKRLVFFRAERFIDAVRDGLIKRGDCAILDECGISFSSRESMTKRNRALSAIFQIMRYKNFGLILTVPNLALIDRAGRDVLNAVLETRGINREEGYCLLKYKLSRIDPIHGKVYRQFVRVYIRNRKVRLSHIRIYRPSEKNIRAYERMKREYAEGKGGLFEEIAEMMQPDAPAQKSERPGIPLTCKCGHGWVYRGTLKRARCGDCGARVVVPTKGVSN